MSQSYQLDTPEAVSVDYDVAGIGTRFLAALVDAIAILGILILILLGVFAVSQLGAFGTTLATILVVVLSFALLWGYYILYETLWSGQTPGKRAFHIRVIKTNGYPVGFIEVVIRNVVRVVDFLPFLYGVGTIVMFINPHGRRLGDLAASTIVVKERLPEAYLPPMNPIPVIGIRIAPRGASDPDELEWNLRALHERDLAIMGEYLERASELSDEINQRIGGRISAHIADQIGARHPHDPQRFLERVAQLERDER